MGLIDGVNYVLFKNPVSSTVIDTTKNAGNALWCYGGSMVKSTPAITPPPVVIPKALMELETNRLLFKGSPIIRLAGLSGALAVMLGAYGAHAKFSSVDQDDRKRVFETANRYHFMHTLALLAAPLSRRPSVVTAVMSLGMIIFCGTCYYDALSGDTRFRKYTPVGGSLLVIGWICFAL